MSEPRVDSRALYRAIFNGIRICAVESKASATTGKTSSKSAVSESVIARLSALSKLLIPSETAVKNRDGSLDDDLSLLVTPFISLAVTLVTRCIGPDATHQSVATATNLVCLLIDVMERRRVYVALVPVLLKLYKAQLAAESHRKSKKPTPDSDSQAITAITGVFVRYLRASASLVGSDAVGHTVRYLKASSELRKEPARLKKLLSVIYREFTVPEPQKALKTKAVTPAESQESAPKRRKSQ